MNATLTIDKAGCVILPKPVRDALPINRGDSLERESSDDDTVLRPARGKARIHTSGFFMATHHSPPTFVTLDAEEYWKAPAGATESGVVGGLTYDALPAR
jgi:AbrB family looped-hinge helix DNA binding protein